MRVQTHLLQQALALGARSGVRAARRLGLPVSVRTLLRLLRRQPLPPAGSEGLIQADCMSALGMRPRQRS